ncbi:hypothetical protein Q1695_001514 [Nippostrongylus brasiliensis]|nr:hypothetical protein Q1695_001514 [Nippostrongylus brasiliensis]
MCTYTSDALRRCKQQPIYTNALACCQRHTPTRADDYRTLLHRHETLPNNCHCHGSLSVDGQENIYNPDNAHALSFSIG